MLHSLLMLFLCLAGWLIATVLEAVVMIALLAKIMRNNRHFEFLIHGVAVSAFYNCFKTRSEESVEAILEARTGQLTDKYLVSDYKKGELARAVRFNEGHEGKIPTLNLERLVKEADGKTREAQRGLDYAIAIAYLSGFGKVARQYVK